MSRTLSAQQAGAGLLAREDETQPCASPSAGLKRAPAPPAAKMTASTKSNGPAPAQPQPRQRKQQDEHARDDEEERGAHAGKNCKQMQQQQQAAGKQQEPAPKMPDKSREDAQARKLAAPSQREQQARQLAASLRAAANEGKVELVRLLLKCGADVNSQDAEFGNTALHQAAWSGFSETIQVLCKHRANTNTRNKALANAPLHLACQRGHNQSARLLLMAGARSELKNSVGDTPLHTAARYGHAGVARILLSARCNPNIVNTNNDTPLHIAAAMGKRKLTKILMQNGAEPMIKNKQGDTAMDIALRRDLIEIQELIANPPPKAPGHGERDHKHRHERQRRDEPEREHELARHQRRARGERDANHQRRHHCNQQQQHSQQAHRHSQQHLLRAPANLIALDDKTNRPLDSAAGSGAAVARPAQRKCQLSISSGQQQPQQLSGRQLLCSQLYSSSAARLPGPSAARKRTSDDHEQQRTSSSDASCRRAPALRGANRRQRDLPAARTPVDAFDRSRTLAAGLGVSSAALDELVRARRLSAAAGPATALARPRPCSAGSARLSPAALARTAEGPAKRARLLRRQPPVQAHSSPAASVRSSLASRVRNSRRTTATAAAAAAAMAPLGPRRLTPGAGRSSLQQLRQMIQKREAGLRAKQRRAPSANSQSSQEPSREESRAPIATGGGGGASLSQLETAPASAPVVAGRRQQREEGAAPGARCQPRAPNGTKLLRTRPLAPLNDDTQLYAIPRKSTKSAKQQQQQVAGAAPAANERPSRADAATPCAAGSRGPASAAPSGAALTASDSGQSLASGSGPLAGAAHAAPGSPATSSSHECAASAPARDSDEPDDRDFGAPGYSVVRARAGSTTGRVGAAATAATAAASAALDQEAAPCLCAHDEQEQRDLSCDQDERLIEPRRVLGGANAELVAAQKSLAAAAAAKVQRDRLVKLARLSNEETLLRIGGSGGGSDLSAGVQSHQSQQQQQAQRQLTVKTDWLQHHQRHQTLVAAAATRVHAHQQPRGERAQLHAKAGASLAVAACALEHTAAGGAHRSGTNSVGMSDSSPSNNGAGTDSDNSIRTTSGAAGSPAADATDADAASQSTCERAPAKQPAKAQRQQTGPFGILSRILLNGASGGGGASASAKVKPSSGRTAEPAAEGAAAAKTNFSGSLSSSSALSSPSISTNGRSPNSTADSAATASEQLAAAAAAVRAGPLDQLASRSRRPIVLSRSNELAEGPDASSSSSPQPHPSRTPTKGVLKAPSASSHAAGAHKPAPDAPDALVNGLPRVSAYASQLRVEEQRTSNNNNNNMNGHANSSLCNYHALNRSHMIQAKYSPYLPYALGRYSIHETCDPSTGAPLGLGFGEPQAAAHYAPGVHYQTNGAYGTTFASASGQNNGFGLSNGGGGLRGRSAQDESSLADASMLCHYSHNDSIYIPPFGAPAALNDYHNSRAFAGAAVRPGQACFGPPLGRLGVDQRAASFIDYNNHHHHHHQHHKLQLQQQRRPHDLAPSQGPPAGHALAARPRSSLGAQAYQIHYGQRLSARDDDNDDDDDAQRQRADAAGALAVKFGAANGALRSQSQLAEPLGATGALSSQQMIAHQNSIYASHHALSYGPGHPINGQGSGSELTVLPTGATSAPSGLSVSQAHAGGQPPAGAYKSLVQVNGKPSRPAELAADEPQPPCLPPKTMTTVGKLTKVSIRPRDWPPAEEHEKDARHEQQLTVRATQFALDLDEHHPHQEQQEQQQQQQHAAEHADDDEDRYAGATVL